MEHTNSRERIRTQHVELKTLLRSVEARFADADGQAVPGLMLTLRRVLRDHFALEEEGGYLSEALAVAPRLSRRAERLHSEHEKFLKRVEELSAELEQMRSGETEWRAIEARVHRFVADLAAHEEAERELLVEAYWDELGGGPG